MSNEVPLIHTIHGNLPISELTYEVTWEDSPEYTKMVETYRRDGEIVRQSAHVLSRIGLGANSLTASLN